MFVVQQEPSITVAVSEGTAFTIQGPSTLSRIVVFQNLDLVNTLNWKFQSSNDNVVFTDLAAFTTLAPLAFTSQTLSGSVFFRMRAFGNLKMAALVVGVLSFNGNFPLVNI